MDWGDMKALLPWRSLHQIAGPLHHVTDDIYRLDRNAYIFLVPYNANLVEDAGSPYATTLIWAPSDGAVQRAINLDVEADDGVTDAPPPDMLLPSVGPTYAELLRGARATYRTTRSS